MLPLLVNYSGAMTGNKRKESCGTTYNKSLVKCELGDAVFHGRRLDHQGNPNILFYNIYEHMN